jgi:hypothetical protein
MWEERNKRVSISPQWAGIGQHGKLRAEGHRDMWTEQVHSESEVPSL